MHIIKLDATDSTNLYLKNLLLTEWVQDFTVVVAKSQLKGRGQMGTQWQSEDGKNLTFSVLKRFDHFRVQDQFQINAAVSLALVRSLEYWQIPDLKVKWPNDILSGTDKICGILIENILQAQLLQASVIGIGLNVNQLDFPGLSKASSLKRITGKHFRLEELLISVLGFIEEIFCKWDAKSYESLMETYESLLFRKDKPSTFRDKAGQLFSGFIRGVCPEGKLKIEIEDGLQRAYGLKEVQLLY